MWASWNGNERIDSATWLWISNKKNPCQLTVSLTCQGSLGQDSRNCKEKRIKISKSQIEIVTYIFFKSYIRYKETHQFRIVYFRLLTVDFDES